MEGIIYKVLPYQESSKLLMTYTPKGKITLIAKGAQKIASNQRVMAQYFTWIDFEPSLKSMFTLKDATLIDAFDVIKKDLNLMKEAAFILELIDKCLIEQENDALIFTSLIHALTKGALLENILRFSLHLITILGYDMPLEADGRKIKGFSIPQARMIYQEEDTYCEIQVEDLVWLLKLKHTKYDIILDIPNLTYQRLKHYIKSFILYHMNITTTN